MSAFSDNLFAEMPVIGIFRGYSLEEVKEILPVYLESGFTNIEVTQNSKGVFTILEWMIQQYGDQLNVGVGTVLEKQDAIRAIALGAQYIVTPIVNKSVIEYCKMKNIPVFPGALTPTEVYYAWKMGAKAVKIFPNSLGSIKYIKALKAPLDQVPLLATGGVGLENIRSFFEAGVFGVGMGSQLFPKSSIRQKQGKELADHFANIKEKIVDLLPVKHG